MSSHFIQYHKLNAGNPVPDVFSARTAKPVSVNRGDVVWLLTAKPSASGTQYAIAYWFKVDQISPESGGVQRFLGREGQRMEPGWVLSTASHSWFDGLLNKTLGNGAFGFKPIPGELIPAFEAKCLETLLSMPAVADDDADIPLDQGNLGSEDQIQMRAVLTRRGQQRFRAELLQAYGRRCPVSESRVEPLLEAAHIVPHSEGTDYRLSNGILLRADLHTLFDLHLLGIDATLRVHLHDSLKHSEFARYQGKRIESLPPSTSNWPSPANLQSRFERFLSKRDGSGACIQVASCEATVAGVQ